MDNFGNIWKDGKLLLLTLHALQPSLLAVEEVGRKESSQAGKPIALCFMNMQFKDLDVDACVAKASEIAHREWDVPERILMAQSFKTNYDQRLGSLRCTLA